MLSRNFRFPSSGTPHEVIEKATGVKGAAYDAEIDRRVRKGHGEDLIGGYCGFLETGFSQLYEHFGLCAKSWSRNIDCT